MYPFASRGSSLVISGDEEDTKGGLENCFSLLEMVKEREIVDRVRIRYVLSMVREGNTEGLDEGLQKRHCSYAPR